ncbi:MAG: EpsI family protein [Pirellulales bacterium]|nr:EpsI family protein [Pirellulales bacterium]
MLRVLPVVLAGVLMVGAGVYQGFMSDRWGRHDSAAVARAVEALKRVPTTIGEWEGTDIAPSAENTKQLQIAKVAGVVQRDYKHRKTGVVVSIYLATGRSQNICVHTPDKCYKAAGFKQEETAPHTLVYGDKKEATFNVGKFRRDNEDGILFLRIFWGWNGGDKWIAPTGRKYALNWYPALFKLYAIRQISNQDQNLAEDPINDFLRQFLPVVDPILFPSSAPTAAPATPDQPAALEKAA